MDVSVIIVNYNTFRLTCACIDSVLTLTRDISCEIILVDNASTETDPQQFIEKFPTIQLISSSKNIGFAKGNNLAITKATGRYVLLLNSDAELKNNVVRILSDFLSSHTDVAAVSSRLEYPDGKVQHNCQRFPAIKYKLFELLRLQKFVPHHVRGKVLFGFFFDYKTVAFPDWIWGTCFMFKKDLLKKLHGEKLADDFFMYGEDVQWCMEFRKAGYRVAFEPAAVVVHHMGKSGASKSALIEMNMKALMNRYYSPLHQKVLKWLDKLLGSTDPL